MNNDFLRIIGFIALNIGGLIFIGFGLKLFFLWLFSSFKLLKNKEWIKSEKNDGFISFFFGGIFVVMPLGVFLIFCGLYWLNKFWNFSFLDNLFSLISL